MVTFHQSGVVISQTFTEDRGNWKHPYPKLMITFHQSGVEMLHTFTQHNRKQAVPYSAAYKGTGLHNTYKNTYKSIIKLQAELVVIKFQFYYVSI